MKRRHFHLRETSMNTNNTNPYATPLSTLQHLGLFKKEYKAGMFFGCAFALFFLCVAAYMCFIFLMGQDHPYEFSIITVPSNILALFSLTLAVFGVHSAIHQINNGSKLFGSLWLFLNFAWVLIMILSILNVLAKK